MRACRFLPFNKKGSVLFGGVNRSVVLLFFQPSSQASDWSPSSTMGGAFAKTEDHKDKGHHANLVGALRMGDCAWIRNIHDQGQSVKHQDENVSNALTRV